MSKNEARTRTKRVSKRIIFRKLKQVRTNSEYYFGQTDKSHYIEICPLFVQSLHIQILFVLFFASFFDFLFALFFA